MRPKPVVLIVRLWQVKDKLRASVRPAHGGATRYFKDMASLCAYLVEVQRVGAKVKPEDPQGLK
ncbi:MULTISPECIES: hypothetical protein [unclassified Meiothermus]|uniref:hypothetical protein n=1 Tax=unclassified Meiothermus TaxID=370471 RepID=UPI000D7BC144|nr:MULTISPECIES: hypothetical protein [unclassified Meiothermus]PZA07335.1 hypothetical protein DNA98_09070 [Meiothermus sp. Pnk-1]RYM37329.1 hypothetical protein EWH23_06495 [Meiothermus sp. PNK-Is4]